MKHLAVEVAVIGASLGGVMAAFQAARAGRRVLLAAEFDWIGGQLTSQAVPPDEHRLIESGGASASYMAMRNSLRQQYLDMAGFTDNSVMTEGCNPGDGWVSRLCIEPGIAVQYLERLLAPLVDSGRLTIMRKVRIRKVHREGRRICLVGLGDEAGLTIVRADWFIDGTDTGALIKRAGLAYRLGKESRADFGESDAPLVADQRDQQPVTMVMALRNGGDQLAYEVPAEYDFWRRHRLPYYGYAQFSEYLPGRARGEAVKFPLFSKGHELDLWRYRRVVCAQNWTPARAEVSLINWAQNDYALHPLLDGPKSESEVVDASRNLSLCLLHWLRTEAPAPDGRLGYPALALAPEMLGTRDGLAQQVYVRESRRIVALSCLTQNDVSRPPIAGESIGRPDSVGIGWYNMDIHPTCVSGHGVNAHVSPFCLPLGCFIPVDCDNLIPASKNIGVTHLVNACTRVHPIEWLIGEVAGLLAAYAVQRSYTLRAIHDDPTLRAGLQQSLVAAGIPIAWEVDLLAKLAINSRQEQIQ